MTALTFSEKLCIAVGVAYRLAAHRGLTLPGECADAGHPDLETDEDFRRLIAERVFWCHDCEEWCDIGQRVTDTELCFSCVELYY